MELPESQASHRKSVLFVTMHKAGSVFVGDVLTQLLESTGMPRINLANEAFRVGQSEAEHCVAESHLFARPGYFFGPFRGPYVERFPDLSANKIILQVRDPRDCIVSFFFSIAYSHRVPRTGKGRQKIMERRENAQAIDINDYARETCAQYHHRLDVIRGILERYDDVLLLEYAEMVENFSGWLQRIIDFVGETIDPATIERLHSRASFQVETEDPSRHVRQVTPGDYQRKLTPETQAYLTRELREHLDYFGYQSAS